MAKPKKKSARQASGKTPAVPKRGGKKAPVKVPKKAARKPNPAPPAVPLAPDPLDEKTWARTWRDLAEAINKSKSTVHDWSQNADAPKPHAERGHCVEDWLSYKLRKEGDAIESAKLTERQKDARIRLDEERIEAQQIENRRIRGETVDLSEAIAVLADSFIQLCREVLAMENTVVPDLTGTVTENKRRFREESLRLLNAFSVGETEAASEDGKKKPFWQAVSAALARLQAGLPRGNGEIDLPGWRALTGSISGTAETPPS